MGSMSARKRFDGRGRLKVWLILKYTPIPTNLRVEGITGEEGIPDAEDEEEEVEKYEDTIRETLFTFDAFEMVDLSWRVDV